MGGVDPKTVDAIVRLVLTGLAGGLLGEDVLRRYRLCDPRCRTAVRGLVARVNDIGEAAENAEDQARRVAAVLD